MPMDPEAATRAYIDGLGSEALATSAAYTAPGHWMILWSLLVSVLVTLIIVRMGITDRLWAALEKRGWALRTFVTTAGFFLVSAIITLPWTVYEAWWHERSYQRTEQPLAASLLLLSPTLIEPLFNDYQPVPEGAVRDAVLVMAAEANIPAERIFLYDGSRQSNNFTANVSGIGAAARIAISDVALTQAALDEVRAVTGHEVGHYVLGHVWRMVLVLSTLAIVLFFFADRLFAGFSRLLGCSAQQIGDPRGIPVLILLLSFLGTLAIPVTNSVVRMGENEADAYSLKMVNLPDALASALVKTAEYRYPRPHPLQEMLFYSHPSVERRVRRAMEWKAAHPPGER